MDNKKKYQKKVPNFFCDICDYSTSRESHWFRHIETEKHKRLCYPKMDNQKSTEICKKEKFICICGKEYKYKSGLCKHRNKCKFLLENININDIPSQSSNNITNLEKNNELGSDLKDIFKAFMKSQTEFNKKIAGELAKPQTVYNNCHNNKMTINVFLNEKCKDALNLTDFVQNIKVTLEDLKYSKDNGFVDGVNNIIKKQLIDLKPTERPIHCTDKKRLKFYVKDNNEWFKDIGNVKIDNTIRDIKLKQSKSISEWEKLNPTYRTDPKLLDEWCAMLAGITENDTGNALKEKQTLKRKIASYIELKEAMEKS